MSKKRFIIVGAGMGGLAAALRLAHLGHKVTVLEKTEDIGGRNRRIAVNSSLFDAGPTLLMMLAPFRKLYSDVGENLEDHLTITRLDPGYRVFFSDRSRLETTPNQHRMKSVIADTFGAQEAEGFDRLMRDLKRMYDVAIPQFVEKNFDRPIDFLTPSAISSVIGHRMMGNLYKRIEKYVSDPKLRMLFSFQTMYLGLSPFEAPWVYAVLTYMEFGEGIYYPEGGLVSIARSIAELACLRGASIRLDSEVTGIEGNRVKLKDGQVLEADAIIVNADLPYAKESLAKETLKPKKHSCSANVLYLDYLGDLPDLLHHNVFFGADFRGNLDQIFNLNQLPEDPSFYAAISSKSDRTMSAPGHANLMILVPCPNLDYPWSQESEEVLKRKVFARLAKETSFDPDKIVGSASFTPIDYRDLLNLSKGAAFGLSHHFNQSAFMRPGNRSRTNPNLYYVGASTIPGNGLPMVLISADLVAQRISRDMRLT